MSAGFKYYGKRARDLAVGDQFKYRSRHGVVRSFEKEGTAVTIAYDYWTGELLNCDRVVLSLDAKVQVMGLSLGF